MSVQLTRWVDSDHDVVRAMAGDASLALQFDKLRGQADLERWIGDPLCDSKMRFIAPDWPTGIEARPFDSSPRAFQDWNDVYNASFARHYHFVPSTVELCRGVAAAPGFNADGLLLAYHGADCVGFCRDEVHATSGEVAALGVTPFWQGRGLGRALLRWGAQSLARAGALPLTLTVDGENEGALG